MWYLKNTDSINFCEKILSSNLKLTDNEKVDTLNRLANCISNTKDYCFAIFKVKDNFNRSKFVKDALDFNVRVFPLREKTYRNFWSHEEKFSDEVWKVLNEKFGFDAKNCKTVSFDVLDIVKKDRGYSDLHETDFYGFHILNIKQKDEKYAFKYLIYFRYTDCYPNGDYKNPKDFKNSREILFDALKFGVVENLFNNHFDLLETGFSSFCKGKDYKQYFPNNIVEEVDKEIA